MTVAMLSNHRRVAPFGLAGGGNAAPGAARVLRKSGEIELLGATASFDVEAGDEIEVLTPGGGAFGEKKSS